MSNIIVTPIPFNPGNVALGTAYTPDSNNNYITLPNVSLSADLQVPAETFNATYTTTNVGKTIDFALAVLASTNVESIEGKEYLKMVFYGQVFFTDSTNDFETIEASILVNKPTDFTTFSVVGPFLPVIDPTSIQAQYDGTDPTKIVLSISVLSFTLPIVGTANVKVQVATGTFA